MLALALAAIVLSKSNPSSPRATEPLLVTTEWLAAHLKDPGLVIFQIGDDASRPAYDAGHIPGAQFLNPFSELSTPRVEGKLILELPSGQFLDSVFKEKGLSNDSRVVLYWAEEYFSPTSRTLLTMEYAGLAGRVSIMDGGLEVWKQEGRPVTTDVPTIARGNFIVRANPGLVVDADFVKSHLQDGTVRIVDARDSIFFDGRRAAGPGVLGHIPGAASLPFGNMVDSNKVRTRTQLKQEFAAAGVRDGQTIVTYCHIGQQATLVWFAARLLGYDAKLYDGSMDDWTKRGLPLENPAAPKPE